MKIRPMQESDSPSVSALLHQLGYDVQEDLVRQRFYLYAQQMEHAFFIAETFDGEVIGFLHARHDHCLHKEFSVEISALVVSEKVRSQGIGQKLMLTAEEWANQGDSARIWLRTNIKRDKAHVFYRRVGYEHISTSLQFSKNAAKIK